MIDLSRLAPDTPPGALLLPAERRTAIIGGKAYMWGREAAYGPLTLSPGYAPGDPRGCQASQAPQLHTGAPIWPRVCVLPRAHGTRHLHKPELDQPGEWWGEPPLRRGPVVAVETLEGMNVTTGLEPDRTVQIGGHR